MTRRLLCAIAFLTRAPLPALRAFDARDVGRAALCFPLVGALLGVLAVAVHHALVGRLPASVIAVVIVGVHALATGAMHLDGLADMADGFGGGRTREDVLRIMRDHAIGAYGACALIFIVLLSVTSVAGLLATARADAVLIAAPALARWGAVPLAAMFPYARQEAGLGAALTGHVGTAELVGATAFAVGAAALLGWRGAILLAAVVAATIVNGLVCVRRIGGITGDTMGANAAVCEALAYAVALGLAG